MLALVAGTPAKAAVITASFSGTASNGTGSGKLTFDDHGGGNTLTVTIDNTSPNVLNSGSGQNSSIITGWGFSTNPDLPDVTSWSVISGNGVNISNKYDLLYDQRVGGYGGGGQLMLEEMVQTDNGINGGIYNAAAPGNKANAYPDIAIFTLVFCTPFTLAQIDTATLRLQRVGTNGAGSLKLMGYVAQQYAAPEPDTLFILFLGVVALFRTRLKKSWGTSSCAQKLQQA